MLGLVLAVTAASTMVQSEPARGAEAVFREAQSIQSREPLRSRTLYEQAARDGYAPAQSALGVLLYKDGYRADALKWLKLAAKSEEPRALLLYGTAMFNGDGVPPNRVEGYAMVKRGAELGLTDAVATQSEMELVMPEAERDAAVKLASASSADTEAPAAADPKPDDKPASKATKTKPLLAEAKTPVPAKSKTAQVQAVAEKQVKATAGKTAAARKPVAPTASASAAGPWRIQLGAFRINGAGQALFARLAPRLPGKQPAFVPAGSLTKLLVGPFATLADASAACRELGRQQVCLPIRVR